MWKKQSEAVSEGLLLSVCRSFFPAGRPVGMMCPADEASLTPRLRRITQTDADDSGSYGQYSYSRYSLDNICNQMATKQSNSRTTTGA